MPIIKQIEFIYKKKFAKALLDKNIKAFIIHIIFLLIIAIYLAREV